jgi:hypothetical protein
MKGGDRFRGVLEVQQRLPGTLVGSIAFPVNKVLNPSVAYAGVQNTLHFPFHFIVDFYRRRGRLYSARKTVLPVRL